MNTIKRSKVLLNIFIMSLLRELYIVNNANMFDHKN